jgi:hypothetical protein
VKRFVASVTLGLIAFAAAALGDAIQKWQTPNGSLYFGDRPPKGSTLVETYADTPALPATVISSDLADLSRAAADGRDIIRRREAARDAERQADTARELRMAEIGASQIDGYYPFEPFWFTGGVGACRFGEPCSHNLRIFHRHVSHDRHNHFFPELFPENDFLLKNEFIPGKRFFHGNQAFGSRRLFPKVSSQFRFAPTGPHARQMSSRFGGRH